MKSNCHYALLLGGLLLLPLGANGEDKPAAPAPVHVANSLIRLHFAKTDVGIVLSALGTRARANIVYSSEKKREIAINIAAPTLEEALNSVAACAGLEYRQVGHTYVVAAPADLKQAIRPFAVNASLMPEGLSAEEGAKLLDATLPYLAARPAGNRLLVSGAEADIAQARLVLATVYNGRAGRAQASAVIAVLNAPAAQIAATLKIMYPDLRAEAIGVTDKPGGTIGISGSRALIEEAKTAIAALDIPLGAAPLRREFRLYPIRYSSAPLLKAFLTNALPTIGVVIGPEAYAPAAPNFRPLSGASVGLVASSGGGNNGANGNNGNGASGGAGASQPSDAGANGGNGSGETGNKSKEGQRAKMLVLSGTSEELDNAVKLLLQLDTPPQQVMVEVKVVDTSPQFAEELGLKYNFAPIVIGNVPPGTSSTPRRAADSRHHCQDSMPPRSAVWGREFPPC